MGSLLGATEEQRAGRGCTGKSGGGRGNQSRATALYLRECRSKGGKERSDKTPTEVPQLEIKKYEIEK